jgi:DNA-directed RNA polymerase specialized sigma24 family protein
VSLPPFESVVNEYGPALLRFCVARAGRGRGEDVFQETMLAALRNYPRLDGPEAIKPWLYAIAANKAIDAHRAAARAPLPVEDPGRLGGGVVEPPSFDGEIWSAVKELPAKQRQAVGLRFLADLSHAEIGEAMGTSTEAARRSVFEGLKRLRREGVADLTFPAAGAS